MYVILLLNVLFDQLEVHKCIWSYYLVDVTDLLLI